MSKLRKLESPAIDRLNGYLAAAGHVFTRSQLDVSLEAAFFEIADPNITDEDVVIAAFTTFNPIERRQGCSLEEMIAGVHRTLSMTRRWWNPEYSGIPYLIERELREGYWEHLKACFKYENARIVELGSHVPYVNMGDAFTYVLYAPDMSRCAILVGNVSD